MAIKSDAQRRAVAKYNDTNYDQTQVRLPKGRKKEIKTHAASRGESTNAFINRAITETIERDNFVSAAFPAPTEGSERA